MKLQIYSLLFLGLIITSCSKKQDDNNNKPEQSAATSSQDNKVTDVTTENSPTTNAVALNPEHGQPGHRCDLQVGQPLNSAPQQAPAPVATQGLGFNTNPNAQPIAAPNNSGQVGKPALNPPHGEPYHNCDIQVGEPLL
ncbi:hypothetical protein [Chryseobacterium sp. T1]